MAQSRQRKISKEAEELYGPVPAEHWWSPHDDRLLIQAAQRGLPADTIQRTIKFSVNYTTEEVSDRWKLLLYNEETAQRVAPLVLKVARVSLKRVPWKIKEDKIIKKEVKKRGFCSFPHLLHHHRKSFHCSRTVSSLESHFWSLKKRGFFEGIELTKARKNTKKTGDDSDEEEYEKKFSRKQKRKRKKASGLSDMKRDKRLVKRIEGILKLEKTIDYSKISTKTIAYLDGMNCRLWIDKEASVVGKRTISIDPDLDLSLENSKTKIPGRTAMIFSKIMPTGIEFHIENLSVKPIYVGDDIVKKGLRKRILHGEIIIFPGNLMLKFMEIKERTRRPYPVNYMREPEPAMPTMVNISDPRSFPVRTAPQTQRIPPPRQPRMIRQPGTPSFSSSSEDEIDPSKPPWQ